MSATQDKTQKITFVYSNLYTLYKKGKEAAQASTPLTPSQLSEMAAPFASGKVLKAQDIAPATVSEFRPTEFIAKRVAKPEVLRQVQGMPPRQTQNHALTSLKQNLQNLNELHSRLQFMLKELEDLVKE